MSSSVPLQGLDLIDCAKANSKAGIEVAAEQCGYSGDLTNFELELQKAGSNIGVNIKHFSDLVALDEPTARQTGIEIAPETPDRL